MGFRRNIEESLTLIASEAATQRQMDFPLEELRLDWESSFSVLTGDRANPQAIACFNDAELAGLCHFNQFIWSLPPEPDVMWHRDNLEQAPWPEVRARAEQALSMLRESASDCQP